MTSFFSFFSGRTLVRMAAVLFAAFYFTGCVQINLTMNLAPDGSGVTQIRLEMLDQMHDMLENMARQSGKEMPLLDEDRLNNYLADNAGQLRKYSNTVKDGVRVIDAVVFVKDVAAFMDATSNELMRLERDGNKARWHLMNTEMSQAFAAMDDALLANQMQMMRSSMSGLNVQMQVTVPHIADTNLQKVGSTTARFLLDFDSQIGEKSGDEAIAAFRALLEPKYVDITGLK
ncbi:hypothetical protein [Acanthopleuribacter pedis]|uniref:Uncharacterized protein n=1 Tax=Acanthopleuribacter pedis TaxID=442870 RepID=A0A8J7QRT7_9BACT|nr:hypothetical protein [Acanthopleuribacter pedis]MBO1323065.1 hypothetical protein [Acanthopleuribacter pedis]